MTEAKVLGVEKDVLRRRKIDLSGYGRPLVEFRPQSIPPTWVVVYSRIGGAHGQFFEIDVDDATGASRFLPGE
jgi:hypothetical protein